MNRARIIPVLLIKNQGLYKTVKFDQSKYIGDPINAVKIFNEKQCDEIVILDILASKEKKEINFKLIEQLASECFMPLSYGGGIRSLSQIEQLLKIGVEKVILNTILIGNIGFLSEAAKNFGTSTLVGSVDTKKNIWGKYFVYNHSVKKNTDMPLWEHIKKIEQSGAGEIILNNADADGTMCGYDAKLAERACEMISIPLTYCGGCRDFNDMKLLLSNTHVSAAAAGSIFVYHGPHNAVLINYPEPRQISEIKKHI